MTSSTRPPDRLRWVFLLIAACVFTFGNGLTGDFTYDDKAVVRDNPRIRSPRVFEQVLTSGYFGRPKGSGTNYRPVLLGSYAVQWWAHGGRAWAFHAVNLVFHAAVTLMLLALLRRAGFPEPQAFGAALLFAVHPIHVESVTSIVGRGETLAALFVSLFLRLTVPSGRSVRVGWSRRLLALACLFLGLLTKESAAVAPLLALLLVVVQEEGGMGVRLRGALRRAAATLAGSAAVIASVLLLRARILGGFLKGDRSGIFELENPLAPLDAVSRMVNACALLFRYLGRAVFPLLLTADESAWSLPLLTVADPISWLWPTLLLALAAAGLAALRGARALAFGILFFVGSFAVSANVAFPVGTIFAERLAYLPSAGVCLILAALLLGPAARWTTLTPRRLIAFLAIVLAFSGRTVVRNGAWRDDRTLFANTAAGSPGSAKAHYNLAYTLAREGDRAGALAAYRRAIAIYPSYFDAWAGKGRMEKELGRLADAEASYLRSLAAQPGYENGHFGLGTVREARGDWGGAEATYREGLRGTPGSLPLRYRLAIVRSRLAPESAEGDWLHALAASPRAPAVRLGYAEWLLGRGRRAEARRQAREALRAQPAWTPAHVFLAERNREEGWTFAEGLARERVFLATRAREDLERLLAVARENPSYGARYETVLPRLRKSAPWLFPPSREAR